ncbi:hypothetical protein [Patulibacter defluvii]|uniref:hypothetical protein n=1 Tax=Patulibacter defluvii TaxID=3095358 RepID=UPI002A75EC41|nr:hypothetical protein [Patulibacter sp. DM4]
MGLTSNRRARTGRASRGLAAALGLASLLVAGPAMAADSMPAPPALPDTDFGLTSFSAGVFKTSDGSNADRASLFTQAGGHPAFASAEFGLASQEVTNGNHTYPGEPYGYTRDIRVDLPAGLVADPTAIPTCTDEQLDNLSIIGDSGDPDYAAVRKGPPGSGCPVASQVGIQRMRVRGTIFTGRNTVEAVAPVYNMTRAKGQVARFAINPRQVTLSYMMDGNLDPIDLVGGVRPSDHGTYVEIRNLPRNPLLVWSKLTLWGVPGDPVHDPERGLAGMALLTLAGPDLQTDPDSRGGLQVDDKTTAFLTNPTSCSGPQTTRIEITSTKGKSSRSSDTTPVGSDGCERLPFAPTTSFGPSALQADAPTPLSVSLSVPQTKDGGSLAAAHVRDVKLTLPPGMSISPSAADGLEACSDRDLAQGTDQPISCPPASKVGRVAIQSPLLDEPLEGAIYLGQPQAGQRYRLFVTAEGRGIAIRLKGRVDADPTSGQLTTSFADNPQLPFSRMTLDFDGGAKAIVASPQSCGAATATTTFTPYSGTAPVAVGSPLNVTGCGPLGFSPGFAIAAGSAQSGAFAPLTVTLSRPDGDQYLGGVGARLPLGMTAKLRGVQRCAEEDVAAASCPAASRIGSVATKAGPGAAPYALNGSLYLTGGYKGAPFGMVAIVRALAGPYDLGHVVVRQALRIDPASAQVTVDSDPLPQVHEGILLRLRELTLRIDRPGFLRNPTSCSTGAVAATLTSAGGATASPAAPLSFTGCQQLRFAPKVRLAVANKTQMGKHKHPRVTATVTQAEGEAGLRSATVALPTSLSLAAANARGLCEAADALKGSCPASSVVGSATAETSILDRPLSGPVYFVKGVRRDPRTGREIKTLPTLYVALRGEVAIDLRSTTAIRRKQLVTTFAAIPDQPITSFTLNINGGRHGIIATTRALCGRKLTGRVALAGQNGAAPRAASVRIGTPCAVRKAQPAKRKSATGKAKTTRR